jgi:MFS transporter, DHA2 family, triacylglyceride efflux pump
VGMLVGLSALTAIGLHRFFAQLRRTPTPEELCPDNPTQCPAYVDALRDAAVGQLHTIFAGAAICAAIAGVIAVVTLPVGPNAWQRSAARSS